MCPAEWLIRYLRDMFALVFFFSKYFPYLVVEPSSSSSKHRDTKNFQRSIDLARPWQSIRSYTILSYPLRPCTRTFYRFWLNRRIKGTRLFSRENVSSSAVLCNTPIQNGFRKTGPNSVLNNSSVKRNWQKAIIDIFAHFLCTSLSPRSFASVLEMFHIGELYLSLSLSVWWLISISTNTGCGNDKFCHFCLRIDDQFSWLS